MNSQEDYSEYFKNQGKAFGKKKGRLIFGGVIALLIILLMSFGGIFMQYFQLKEIGENYTSVFWTNFSVRIFAQLIGFVVLFILFFINLILIRRIIRHIMDIPKWLSKNLTLILITLVISFIGSAMISSGVYTRFLMFANATQFNTVDPIFSQDIGYYIFTRPFYMSLVSSLSGILLFQLVYTLIIYFMVSSTALSQGIGFGSLIKSVLRERTMVVHTITNIMAYFIVVAFSYKFKAEELLYSSFGKNGEVFGAGFTDINIWLVFYKIAPYLIIAIVIFTLIFLFRKKILWCGIAIAIFPAAFIVTSLVSGIVQTLVVNPDEQTKETEYIGYNLSSTKSAYGLDKVEYKRFDVKNDLTPQDINANMDRIDDIRISDYRPLLTATNQLQFIKYYYKFNDVDVVPYEINGRLTALATSARELNKENLDESSKTYVNTKFRYTHGFGTVGSPLNKISENGQPVYYIKDIPPISTNGLPEIKQPRIYYGELTNDYVITGNKEFDYSDGEKDYDFNYDGKSGLGLGLLNRLIFAAYYKDINILVSGNITNQSKILINRNILYRAKLLAPFITYDSDPYLIITDDGRQKWILDGYTVSDKYPYSQHYGNSRMNYIRNSIKVVVDAYDGNMDYYIIDKQDPIAATLKKIYPNLFNDDEIPKEISSHIRIPEWIFKVQASMFEQYHVSTPVEFYNRTDLWRTPNEKFENDIIPIEPYFNVMNLDENSKDELLLIMPFSSGNKDNMVGWLAARSSGDNYGKLIVYEFPKTTSVYGPLQIENKIDNDPDISRDLSLWKTGGSSVIRGNLLVIPFKSSLLYVEPIYITSENKASLPEIKRIVVSYKDKIVMRPTIREAIAAIFPEGVSVKTPTQNTTTAPNAPNAQAPSNVASDELATVVDLFGEYKQYNAAGDWENAGKKLKELEAVIQRLQK